MGKPTYKYLSDIIKSEKAIKQSNKKRAAAHNILNLAMLGNMDRTAAERALEQISGAGYTGSITMQDIDKFNRAYQHLLKDNKAHGIRGGIKPRTIIDKSLRVDIDRAQREIPTIRPVSISADGVVKFWTSASAKSKDSNHYVKVQFLNFGAAIATNKLTAKVLDMVLQGGVKFDCDCGRHRYWYRYIATAGGYYLGAPESGFPKIRNPNLKGLACKHTIKTMILILKSPVFREYMKQAILRYQKNPNAAAKTQTDRQVDQFVKKASKENWQGKQIRQKRTLARPERVPDGFMDLKNPTNIRGAKIKPVDISKKLHGNKSAAQKKHDMMKAIQNADLTRLSPAQLAAIQAIINEK